MTKHMEMLDRMPFEATKAVFEKLLDVADLAGLTPQERSQYNETLKKYRDYVNTVNFARDEGRDEGREEKALEIARNLKRLGLSFDVISANTGVMVDEIETL